MFILYNNYITTLLFVIKSLVELNIRFIVSFFFYLNTAGPLRNPKDYFCHGILSNSIEAPWRLAMLVCGCYVGG